MKFSHMSENGPYHTYQCEYADLTYTIVYDNKSDHIIRIEPHLYGGVDIVADQFKTYLNGQK